MITHISFDLWLTLIKSNPLYKQKRAELIALYYNPKMHTPQEVFEIIKSIDRASDRLNEYSGTKISALQMYSTICRRLGYHSSEITPELLNEIKQHATTLFLQHPPVLLNDAIVDILCFLRDNSYTISLASNTGFIDGEVIDKTLQLLEIDNYFSYKIYSDQIGVSKPSAHFFEAVYSPLTCPKQHVLHIGDNPKADVGGASAFGFHSLHANSETLTIDFIRNYINEKNTNF